MGRRHLVFVSALAILVFIFSLLFLASALHPANSQPMRLYRDASHAGHAGFILPSLSFLDGRPIAPKLDNATAKADLGRASWTLLHTMMARFPEKPTPDERVALNTFLILFGRFYPCGECATHFQALLHKFPPQTSSRNAAAGWACHVHNQVNRHLEKSDFDCSKIGDYYDCGCAGDESKVLASLTGTIRKRSA